MFAKRSKAKETAKKFAKIGEFHNFSIQCESNLYS